MTYCLKLYDVKVASEPGQRWVAARISTVAVDSDGDVVLPSGGDFRQFEKNPLVLYKHGMADHQFPVGTAQGITKRTNDIVAKVQFATRPDTHPAGLEWVPDTLHELYKQGVMRAFSIGFVIPMGGSRTAESKDLARFGDGVRRVITKWQLKELSAVPIPANQDALAMAVSKGWMPKHSYVAETMGVVDDLLDMVERRPILRLDEPKPIRLD